MPFSKRIVRIFSPIAIRKSSFLSCALTFAFATGQKDLIRIICNRDINPYFYVMEIKSYFENVPDAILEELKKAQFSIVAAVAWITNEVLFEVLCKKAQKGLYVVVLILEHEINNESDINYKLLESSGGQLYAVKNGNAFMHHKFCVIDNRTVVTGSANWTNNASYNNENIVVINDDKRLATTFIVEFYKLFDEYNISIQSSSKLKLNGFENLVVGDYKRALAIRKAGIRLEDYFKPLDKQ